MRTFAMLTLLFGVTVKLTGVPVVVAFGLAVKLVRPKGLTVIVTGVAAAIVPALAPTLAVCVVVSVVEALPAASVVALPAESVPLSVLNVTGTPGSGPPASLTTVAVTMDVPPDDPRVAGDAATVTCLTAAVPILTLSLVVLAPPEYAVMIGVPLSLPVISFTCTEPLCVRASAGSIRPIVVVKVISVPFWTGVPLPRDDDVPLPPAAVPFSMTVATIVSSLLSDTVSADGMSVMTLPVGASSGTLSHAAVRASVARRSGTMARRCVTIGGANNSSLMSLRGQEDRGQPPPLRGFGQAGYAMAALLVALAVMAVLMSVALPVWRHDAQREKEEELIFRGQQYVRAIRLFQSKTNSLPMRVDDLVQQRFLRKRYKDPITKEDFEIGRAHV